jgi:hypothetical protein
MRCIVKVETANPLGSYKAEALISCFVHCLGQ